MKTHGRVPRRLRLRGDSGFSLVITLMMMVLLTLLALGMLSLSTISLRSTEAISATATARANARLAIMMAISDLQKYAGPDQRVTASADIIGATTNTKWTGVWTTTRLNTPAVPVVGGISDPNYLTDLRSTDATMANGLWRTSLRLGWLVSGDSPAPGGASNTVELVGTGSLGSNPSATDRVTVPSVIVNQGGKSYGAYAYWVGDESQKARIDQASPYGTKTPNPANVTDGGYYRLAGADGPGFSKVKAAAATPYGTIDAMAMADRQKLISRSTTGLSLAQPDPPKRNFHDITTKSQSVLADVRAGGLKKDLTAFLESPSGIPVVSGLQDSGLSSTQAMLPGAKYQDMGPNFAHIKNWYNLRTKVTGALGSGSIPPQYIASRTATSSDSFPTEGYTMDLLQRTQAIQPVLAGARMAYDFSLDTSRAGGRGVRFHVYPRVTLWNPYNVILKGARYLVGFSVQNIGGNVTVGGKAIATLPGDPNIGQMYAGVQSQRMVYFMTSPIDFQPGECLVFSPDYSASFGGPKIGGNSVQYSPTDISANVLSAAIPTGQNNFYFPAGYQVDSTVNLGATPIQYGINFDVNAALVSGKCFNLKKVDGSGSISYDSIKSSASFATIDELLMDYNGKKNTYWWDVFGYNTVAVNNATLPGFSDYTLRPSTNPPRLWYIEGRLRWLDETDEQQSLGQQWGQGAGLLYHNPVIGNFNVRGMQIHRSPFCFYDDWTRYAPGPSMLPWASPRLGDTRAALPYTNSKSYGSPFGLPSDWSAVKSYAMFDIPQTGTPIFSLADFQHVEFGYQGWQPTYIVGNSIAEPRSNRDASVNTAFYSGSPWSSSLAKGGYTGSWDDLIQNKSSETLIYDSSFSLNQVLWDRYFLSTIPYDPSGSGSVQWNMVTDLPNSRMILQKPQGLADTTIKTYFTGTKPFDYSAYFLMNKGAFNINSTSLEAWRAFFSTLNRVSRPDAAGGSAINTFARLLVPRSSALPASTKSAGTWSGTRTLTEGEIDSLATQMVSIVKARGPFLGLADFVNRRLKAATTSDYNDESFCGPLQAAIERANLNSKLQATGDNTQRAIGGAFNGSGCLMPDVAAYFPWKTFGAPGYLTQADMLQTLGPNMTARGDTFVIRTYGDARDSTGKILARAWCEATVQRTPDYVVGNPITLNSSTAGNNPLEPVTVRNPAGFALVNNASVQAVNQKFGRRLTVVDFRWLNQADI